MSSSREYSPDLEYNHEDMASAPFIEVDGKSLIQDPYSILNQSGGSRTRTLTINLLLIVFYALGYLTSASTRWLIETPAPPNLSYSPAASAATYKKSFYDGTLNITNQYRGEPRPELDEAWKKLLMNINIRLREEELGKLNRTTIALYDNSGYYGQLSVYHHLHCLKFLRQVFHPNYYPEINTADRDVHVDHCFDDIRQALMCHADLSVVTLDWRDPQYRRPWPNFSVDHTCVDWEALDNWAAERSFSAFDQKSLVHPTLGLAFPMVNGKIEYISHGPDMHVVWPK